MQSFDLIAHLKRQRAFSRATFGPGARTKGVIDHIRKELIEIEKAPDDITEWVDVVLLALDGLWRASEFRELRIPIEVAVGAIDEKQSRNERRDWPDWRGADPDKAIEHKRTETSERRTFTVPAGHVAVLDAEGRATGETRRCPKPSIPRRPCLFPQCDCDVGGGP